MSVATDTWFPWFFTLSANAPAALFKAPAKGHIVGISCTLTDLKADDVTADLFFLASLSPVSALDTNVTSIVAYQALSARQVVGVADVMTLKVSGQTHFHPMRLKVQARSEIYFTCLGTDGTAAGICWYQRSA